MANQFALDHGSYHHPVADEMLDGLKEYLEQMRIDTLEEAAKVLDEWAEHINRTTEENGNRACYSNDVESYVKQHAHVIRKKKELKK